VHEILPQYFLFFLLFWIANKLINIALIHSGKTSPYQLIVMTFIESFAYSVNKVMLCLGVVEFVDAGGTINIHMFGAYFGLAVAWMLGRPPASAVPESDHNSDLFSMIGTLFLWIYWPSFNAAVVGADTAQQQRGVVNTILALCAATVAAFLWSSLLSSSHKFRPVDIQNASLAGGVAMGAVCDLTLNGSDSLLIGFAAGTVSTIGYNRVQEWMERKLSIHDTCGVHNLHGMPSILGGAATTILAAIKAPRGHDMPHPWIHRDQAFDQFISILFTLGMAVTTGLLTGYILTKIRADESTTEFYSDEPYWEIEEEHEHKPSTKELEQGVEASAALQKLMSSFKGMAGEEDTDSISPIPYEKRGAETTDRIVL
jgi:ammonium transporter Rh